MYFHYLGVELYGYWLASGILAWVSMIDMASVTSQGLLHTMLRRLPLLYLLFWTGLCYNTIVVPVLYLLLTGCLLLCCNGYRFYVCDIRSGIQLGAGVSRSVLWIFRNIFFECTSAFCLGYGKTSCCNLSSRCCVLVDHGIRCFSNSSCYALGPYDYVSIIILFYCFCICMKRGLQSQGCIFRLSKEWTAALLSSLTGIGARLQPTLVTIFVGAELAAVYDATLRVAMLAQAVSMHHSGFIPYLFSLACFSG